MIFDRAALPILRFFALLALWSVLFLAAPARSEGPEQSTVRLAVGGKPALFYLPLTVTERLGYFPGLGLNVGISDFPGGARAAGAHRRQRRRGDGRL